MSIGAWMVLTVICMIVALFGFLICWVEDSYKGTGIWFAVLIIGFFLCLYPACRIEKTPYERPDKPYVTHEIMCLADNNMLSGRIYLRSGYINENHHYLYGYKTASGGMKTQKVRADTAVVYFNDDVNPSAKWYEETRRLWFLTDTRITCDIYVPTDSLAADYTIDLQ